MKKIKSVIKKAKAYDTKVRSKAAAMEAGMPVKVRPAVGSTRAVGNLRKTELMKHARSLQRIGAVRGKTAARGMSNAAAAAMRRARRMK